VAPPGGDGFGANAVLGGEEGDDLTKDLVGEAGGKVDSVMFFSPGARLRFLVACRFEM
jgi:hypothetical protein